jgi:hypothetical protein
MFSEIEIAGLRVRSRLLNPSLVKACTFLLLYPDSTVTRDPEKHNLVPARQSTQCLSILPDKLWCYSQCFDGLQCCLAINNQCSCNWIFTLKGVSDAIIGIMLFWLRQLDKDLLTLCQFAQPFCSVACLWMTTIYDEHLQKVSTATT